MARKDYGNPPVLDSAGKQTNPTTATVLADTGALVAGLYEVRVLLGASAAAIFALERRNAANGANVGDVPAIYVPAAGSLYAVFTYVLEASERLRVVMETNLTGTAAATLQVERLT